MKNLIIFTSILLYIIITPTTAAFWGIKQVGTSSSVLLVSNFLYVLLFRNKKLSFAKFKIELWFFTICIAYVCFRIMMNDYESFGSILFFIMVPLMISVLVKFQELNVKQKIAYILIVIFIAECSLAIWERIFQINVFPYLTDNDLLSNLNEENWQFRSSAFFGHPLNNAVIVSTMMGFILISEISTRSKSIYIALGYIALLCFNARGAIIIWSVMIFYLLILQKKKGSFSVLKKIALITIVCTIGYYLLFNTNLGGRLVNQEKIMDGSAMTRIEAFSAFNFVQTQDFWLGNPNSIELIMNKLNAAGVENSYVLILLIYGAIFGSLIIVLFLLMVKNCIIKYDRISKIIIILSFILVGSLNNSLAGSSPWAIFYLCVNSFPFVHITSSQNMKMWINR